MTSSPYGGVRTSKKRDRRPLQKEGETCSPGTRIDFKLIDTRMRSGILLATPQACRCKRDTRAEERACNGKKIEEEKIEACKNNPWFFVTKLYVKK